MKKLSNLFIDLAKAAGLPDDAPGLKTILSNSAFAEMTVPDDLSTALLNNLLTVESAKAHPQVKAHLLKSALNPIDMDLTEYLTTNSYPEILEEINKEKSSYAKVKMALSKIREFESKKAKAGEEGKDLLTETIKKLNDEILLIKGSHSQELKNRDLSLSKKIEDLLFNNLISQYDYDESGSLSKEDAIDLARINVSKELKARKLKIASNENQDGLVLTQEDGTPYFEENKQINFKDFGTKILTNKKLLTLSKQPGSQGSATPPVPPVPPGGSRKNTSAMETALNEAEKAFVVQ